MSCRKAFEIDLAAFLMEPRAPQWDDFRTHYPRCPECAPEVRAWTELGAHLDASHPDPAMLVQLQDTPAALDPGERARLATHVAACPTCADELRALRGMAAAIPMRHAEPARAAPAPRRRPSLLAGIGRLAWHPAVAYAVLVVTAVPLLLARRHEVGIVATQEARAPEPVPTGVARQDAAAPAPATQAPAAPPPPAPPPAPLAPMVPPPAARAPAPATPPPATKAGPAETASEGRSALGAAKREAPREAHEPEPPRDDRRSQDDAQDEAIAERDESAANAESKAKQAAPAPPPPPAPAQSARARLADGLARAPGALAGAGGARADVTVTRAGDVTLLGIARPQHLDAGATVDVRVVDDARGRELREHVVVATGEPLALRVPSTWLTPGSYRVEVRAGAHTQVTPFTVP